MVMEFNRHTIETLYDINERGFIETPGKFVGCKIYVPYFYEVIMHGFYDEVIDEQTFVCRVEKDDLIQFPELAGKDKVTLMVSDQGFIHEL